MTIIPVASTTRAPRASRSRPIAAIAPPSTITSPISNGRARSKRRPPFTSVRVRAALTAVRAAPSALTEKPLLERGAVLGLRRRTGVARIRRRLGVDVQRQQAKARRLAVPLEQRGYEAIELRLVVRLAGPGEPGARGDSDVRHASRVGERLAAAGLVPIVHEHRDAQVRRTRAGDRHEDAEVHGEVAVALEQHDAPLRPREREPERERRRGAHRVRGVIGELRPTGLGPRTARRAETADDDVVGLKVFLEEARGGGASHYAASPKSAARRKSRTTGARARRASLTASPTIPSWSDRSTT